MIVYFQENSLICKCSPIWRRHCDESLCSAPKTSCLPKLPISDVASFFGGKSWNVGKVGKVGKASAAEPSPLIRKSPGCIQCFLLPFFCAVLLAKCRSIFFLFAGAASLRLFSTRAQHPVGKGRDCSTVGCPFTSLHIYIFHSAPTRMWAWKTIATNGKRQRKIFRWSAIWRQSSWYIGYT